MSRQWTVVEERLAADLCLYVGADRVAEIIGVTAAALRARLKARLGITVWGSAPAEPPRPRFPVDAPTECVKCDGPLYANHDELECIVHGTQWTPKRAWDTAGGAGVEAREDRARQRAASIGSPRWTADEIEEWREAGMEPPAAAFVGGRQ